MTFQLKRVVSLGLLCVAFAFAVSTLPDIKWVEDTEFSSTRGQVHIGLYKWQIVDHPTAGDSAKYDLTDNGEGVFTWNPNQLGSRDDWKNAGRGALGMGAIAVIFAGIAAIGVIAQLVRKDFTKVVGAGFAFASGVSFLLGACIYEGMRPTWGGSIGYAHPMGLYLGAGIVCELAAMILHSADYVPEKY